MDANFDNVQFNLKRFHIRTPSRYGGGNCEVTDEVESSAPPGAGIEALLKKAVATI